MSMRTMHPAAGRDLLLDAALLESLRTCYNEV